MSLADVPNSAALPQSVQMKLKPNAVPAVRKRLNIQAYTSPTNPITSSQLIQFYVPARKNTMYDPTTMYLRGRISGTNPANATTFLNRNAFSLINRLQVYGQDSTLLEDIQNYNDLCHTLMDIQMSQEDKRALSAMYGGSETVFNNAVSIGNGTVLATSLTNQVADGTATANTVGGVKAQLGVSTTAVVNATLAQTSYIDRGVAQPAATPDANGLRFCIPIVSAFGLLADTMIPVGWLNSDLRFDFYTETPQVAFRDTAPAAMVSYSLSDLELVVDTVEFDPAAMALVNQVAPVSGPLYCHASTYKTYTSTLAAGTNSFYSTLVPHRSLSVKQLLVAAHSATAYGQTGFDSFHRILPYGTTNMGIQLSIGGLKHPQKAIGTYAEAFAELQKSQHSFNQLILNGSIGRSEYFKFETDITNAGDEIPCKSALGFDLEIYDKKGNTIVNGQNWTGLNVFMEGQVSENGATQVALGADLTLHNFVQFDTIYVIQDGTISVRF